MFQTGNCQHFSSLMSSQGNGVYADGGEQTESINTEERKMTDKSCKL